MNLFSIGDYWENYGFEILVLGSIIFLFLYALFRLGKKGTYSTSYPLIQSEEVKQKPRPRDSKGETICRQYLEKRFLKPFPKIRPNFLRNPVTGGNLNLELDCFNEELQLGVEYNGVQHYKFCPFFHRNKEAFLNQKYRDEMKRVKCRDAGVKLIEVPYTVPAHKIENYIENNLIELGFK